MSPHYPQAQNGGRGGGSDVPRRGGLGTGGHTTGGAPGVHKPLRGNPSNFREVPGRPIAFVTGVGFWDLCTGAHKPRGAAPNCIELHPVLDIDPISP